jgi:hypothetical protein
MRYVSNVPAGVATFSLATTLATPELLSTAQL